MMRPQIIRIGGQAMFQYGLLSHMKVFKVNISSLILITAHYISGIKTSLNHWSRCNIPFKVKGQEILPEDCDPYVHAVDEEDDDPESLVSKLNSTIFRLKEGYKANFVYYTGIDNKGHSVGPEGAELYDEVEAVDAAIQTFLDDLEESGLASHTNFVIVADHGMTAKGDDKVFEKVYGPFSILKQCFAGVCQALRLP